MEVDNVPHDVVFDSYSKLWISKSLSPILSSLHPINTHHLSPPTDTDADTTSTGGCHHLLLYYETHESMKESYSLHCTTTFEAKTNFKLQIPFNSMYGFLRIVGSCQGLVCLFDTNFFTNLGNIIFWNPSIKKFKLVENPLFTQQVLSHSNSYSHMIVGFGFVLKNDDFKVVEILYDSGSNNYSPKRCTESDDSVNDSAVLDVLVYSMSNDSWKKIEAVAPCYIPRGWSNNVFVNGSLNWLAFKEKPKLKEENKYDSIMEFDLGDEVFRVLDFPSKRNLDYDRVWLSSSSSGRSLSLFFLYQDNIGDRLEIWSMKEYGKADSWVKIDIIEFSRGRISSPLGFLSNGEVLLVINKDFGKLMLYQPKNAVLKDLKVNGSPSSFRIVNYSPSFVLNDNGQVFIW